MPTYRKSPDRLLTFLQVLLCGGLLLLYVQHVRSVYESRTSISLLSQFEREALLRGEDALYYTFYKTLTDAPDFLSGIMRLRNMSGIEYPESVNVLHTFHIFPEVVIGGLYHLMQRLPGKGLLGFLSCWSNDGPMDASSIHLEASECIGTPLQFYLECVWLSGGLTMVLIYVHACHLNRNHWCGLYAVISYLMCHSYAGIIYEKPMARENFALPAILMQMLCVTLYVQSLTDRRSYKVPVIMSFKLALFTAVSLICWHFSSVIFAIQIVLVTIPWTLESLPTVAVLDLFQNEYAWTQLFAPFMAYYLSEGHSRYLYSCQLGPAFALMLISLSRYLRFRQYYNEELQLTPIPSSPSSMNTFFLILVLSPLHSIVLDLMNTFGVLNVEPTHNGGDVYFLYHNLLLRWLFNVRVNFTTSMLACSKELSHFRGHELWEIGKRLLLKPYYSLCLILSAHVLCRWRNYTFPGTSDGRLGGGVAKEKPKKMEEQDFKEEKVNSDSTENLQGILIGPFDSNEKLKENPKPNQSLKENFKAQENSRKNPDSNENLNECFTSSKNSSSCKEEEANRRTAHATAAFSGTFYPDEDINYYDVDDHGGDHEHREQAIERAQKYLLEDYIEERRLTLNQMGNLRNEKTLNDLLKLLAKCDYDYDRFKREREREKEREQERLRAQRAAVNDHVDFLNEIQSLKRQIKTNRWRTTINEKEEGRRSAARSNRNVEDKRFPKNFDALHSSRRRVPLLIGELRKINERSDASKRCSSRTFPLRYNCLQMLVYCFFGLAVRRLFFLCYVQFCIMSSLICGQILGNKQRDRYWLVYFYISSILLPGFFNLSNEYYSGERLERSMNENRDLNAMLEWIQLNTESNAVFGGPIDVIGTVHLTTKRSIVNHANLEMRRMSYNTDVVYSAYGRQPSAEIYNHCAQLKIQYLIVSSVDCNSEGNSNNEGCDFLSLWDELHPSSQQNPQFCSDVLVKNVPSFLIVFSNDRYAIVKIFSQSIQLNLKYNKLPERAI